MNVFALHQHPIAAAKMHCDKHVVKMILETAQLLSTAHRMLDGTLEKRDSVSGKTKIKYWVLEESNMENVLYRATMMNHPCAIWIRETDANYMWAYNLFVGLCDEYTHRYGKVHKTDALLRDALMFTPKNIKRAGLTKFPQAMPDDVKHEDSIVAYRQYYLKYKSDFAKWTKRDVPTWYDEVHGTNACYAS